MAKKVLVISTSLRGGSNSEILARECARGAADAGLEVEYVSLKDKEIRNCIGCLTCHKGMPCVLKDDGAEVIGKIREAEAVVFATPIYYYEMSGQMKTLLDRSNPLYGRDYNFRDIYFIASAADTDEHTFDRAISGLEGWICCFDKCSLKGTVVCGDVNDAKSVNGKDKALKEVYELVR